MLCRMSWVPFSVMALLAAIKFERQSMLNSVMTLLANKITLKLWEIVVEVNEKDRVVSLPGGLRGLIHAGDALDSVLNNEVRGTLAINLFLRDTIILLLLLLFSLLHYSYHPIFFSKSCMQLLHKVS